MPNNLKRIRLAKGMKQKEVAKYIGISQNAYSYWETGRNNIDSHSLAKLSKLFAVSVDYILGESNVPTTQGQGIKIPVLGTIPAGVPVEAIEEILDYEEITEDMAATGDYFALRIKGDSMEPKISDGDVVIVRKQSDVDSGRVAVVLLNGNEATVKKLVKHEDGVSLVPFNGAYSPKFYPRKEVQELPLVVLGLVVELRAKMI
jgi:repressor LexA